ncbi:hypothetical protein M409DRAFT_36327 [Zasmidium cellare ATCC 36951]|uniref:Uncharacterized protein n=1 Tax=Zasmidium cellare ATCC 36951 TaxID=1080233 RepID=A0A6A6CQZ9_ZASCE|nr:uncharacterized protein M409DRAFT_36327 [Zasmidium cellare ATCC 36951]KAF2168570.1 hypothetical protein M409DRAFT_36327 [Zasmidium cellare ATCC 36951]
MLGLAKGSQDSGLRFQAENAHRLPTTQTGWFLYHKSKNYNMMLGGIVEGMKQAGKFGLWAGCFFVLEEGIDRGRAAGVRIMLAGLGSAGIFSAWNRLPLPTVARTAKMGAKVGLAFGLLQDALNVVKGKRVGYVEFVKRHTVGEGDTEAQAEKAPA